MMHLRSYWSKLAEKTKFMMIESCRQCQLPTNKETQIILLAGVCHWQAVVSAAGTSMVPRIIRADLLWCSRESQRIIHGSMDGYQTMYGSKYGPAGL